ncbi:MAG: hypothetical protein H0T84_08600 [Tatlockia sp.]|nr:hypothetical protein [Tatlockia sp.]
MDTKLDLDTQLKLEKILEQVYIDKNAEQTFWDNFESGFYSEQEKLYLTYSIERTLSLLFK